VAHVSDSCRKAWAGRLRSLLLMRDHQSERPLAHAPRTMDVPDKNGAGVRRRPPLDAARKLQRQTVVLSPKKPPIPDSTEAVRPKGTEGQSAPSQPTLRWLPSQWPEAPHPDVFHAGIGHRCNMGGDRCARPLVRSGPRRYSPRPRPGTGKRQSSGLSPVYIGGFAGIQRQ
jgi:hypothetical protein